MTTWGMGSEGIGVKQCWQRSTNCYFGSLGCL